MFAARRAPARRQGDSYYVDPPAMSATMPPCLVLLAACRARGHSASPSDVEARPSGGAGSPRAHRPLIEHRLCSPAASGGRIAPDNFTSHGRSRRTAIRCAIAIRLRRNQLFEHCRKDRARLHPDVVALRREREVASWYRDGNRRASRDPGGTIRIVRGRRRRASARGAPPRSSASDLRHTGQSLLRTRL